MSHTPNENARHSMDRIVRLERRMRQLLAKSYKSGSNIAEISAIEWAVPILEKWVHDNYGYAPPKRANYYKHEKSWLVEILLKRDGDICYLCNEQMAPGDETIDHVIPLFLGGKDDTTNYRLAHEPCNLEKGNLTLEAYLAGKEKAQSA